MPSTTTLPHLHHPCPQRRRARWIDLNGFWRFALDPDQIGLQENWQLNTATFPLEIRVPFCVESAASGLEVLDAPPVVWYGRQVEMPEGWAGQRILLSIGASDFLTRVWVNGEDMGVHRGGYSLFTLDITHAVHERRFELAIRVEDWPTSEQPRGKQASQAEPHLIWYRRCTGIWRDVWLEAVPEQYLRNFFMMADWHRQELTLIAQGHRVDDRPLLLTVIRKGEICLEKRLEMNGGRVRAELDLAELCEVVPWTLESPAIYNICLQLGDDVVATYFGLRDVGVRKGRFHLNEQPVYLKLVLEQNYYPRTLYTDPGPAAVLREVELIRALGFNGVRMHQITPSNRFRYCCDMLGLIILVDMPGQTCDHPELGEPRLTAETRANFLEEYTELISTNFNSPSIVGWTPYNESWGIFHVQDDAGVQAWARKVVDLTRHLDPTRLVIGNDGWSAVETDLLALHFYAVTGRQLEQVLTEWSKRKFSEFPPLHPVVASGNPDTGAPLFLSEYGGISFDPGNPGVGTWGYGKTENTPEAFYERYRSMQLALADHPAVMGYCYTQLTDCELEINGLLTAEREPKLPIEVIRELNEMVHGRMPEPAPAISEAGESAG